MDLHIDNEVMDRAVQYWFSRGGDVEVEDLIEKVHNEGMAFALDEVGIKPSELGNDIDELMKISAALMRWFIVQIIALREMLESGAEGNAKTD